jgi:hypothetical protein
MDREIVILTPSVVEWTLTVTSREAKSMDLGFAPICDALALPSALPSYTL